MSKQVKARVKSARVKSARVKSANVKSGTVKSEAVKPAIVIQAHHISSAFASRNTGYCVWVWKQQQWFLNKDRCMPKCKPQKPLSDGRFEGQFRAVICIPDEFAK
jgi:hypothetical protein